MNDVRLVLKNVDDEPMRVVRNAARKWLSVQATEFSGVTVEAVLDALRLKYPDGVPWKVDEDEWN